MTIPRAVWGFLFCFGISTEFCESGGVAEKEVSELSCPWFLESLHILEESGAIGRKYLCVVVVLS